MKFPNAPAIPSENDAARRCRGTANEIIVADQNASERKQLINFEKVDKEM